jgi:hypothetical protein
MIIDLKNKQFLLLPDIAQLARSMTSQSQIQIVLEKVRKLSISQIIKVGIRNIPGIFSLIKKDFSAGMMLLAELEFLVSKSKGLPILHHQIVEMAIALQRPQILSAYFLLAKYYRFAPFIFSYNPEKCLKLLSFMKMLPVDLVLIFPYKNEHLLDFAKHSPFLIGFLEKNK